MINFFQDKLNIKEETSLKTHKYKTIDKSILSFLIFRKYTSMIIKYTPTYLAPNLITMIGYSAMLFNFLVVMVLDPSLKNGSPLLSFFSAICLLIYFTADNIDGAQARKLNEMSPMGQMFDHGVDSCCVFFCLFALISSLKLGFTFTSLMLITCVMSGFYLSGLEEKFTGIFEFNYISGPTEGLFLIFFLHLVSVFYKEHVHRILLVCTFSPFMSRVLNISNISPLFVLCVVVTIYNIISSYLKSLTLGDLKSKSDVTKGYFYLTLVFIPLIILHRKFEFSPKLQMINLLIFSLCFSLNYIEDVFSTIVNSSKRKTNWVFIGYLVLCLCLSICDIDNYSICLYTFLTISISHYIYNVYALIKLCKKALKINVFTLNRKIKIH